MPVAAPKPPNPNQTLDLPVLQEGSSSFTIGMDSFTQPSQLIDGEYPLSLNTINRGGTIQTRPGSKSLLDQLALPPGKIQGLTLFQSNPSSPSDGNTYLVFAIAGLVYASPAPFRTYTQLQNIQLNPNSKYVTWASCLKSTDYDATGTLYSLAQPIRVLMIQDGNSRCAYWDGSNSGQLNPTVTPGFPQTTNISYASNASPIVITLSQPIVIGDNEQVIVQGVLGNLAANGTWTATVIDSTHISLQGSTGSGNYTASGVPFTVAVSDASFTTPIVITTATGVIFGASQSITISGITGNTNANGTWNGYPLDSTHIVLLGSSGNGTSFGQGTASTGLFNSTGTITTNPESDGFVATLPGYDGTPIGLWMVWSNNRLWVSNGSKVYASDIGNPMKFTEDQYIADIRSFLLPDVCTGAIETPDKTGVIFFTRDVGVFLQSSIQDRTQWESTQGFQTTVLPNMGCCAPRSLVQQYGLIWWFTPKGLTSQNAALQANISSQLYVQDNEMIASKENLSYDLSMVCGASFENFLFHAVPSGDKLNNRLHVLDQAPWEGKMNFWMLNSWPSYWKGWRPVEFARGTIGTTERVFCISYDYDGVNRIWELFQSDRTDNGIPITCFVETRPHYFGNRDYKDFRYADVDLIGLVGPSAWMVAVAGMRGAYQPIMTKDINAVDGQIYATGQYGANANQFAGSFYQTRVVRTMDNNQPNECNSACIESDRFRGFADKCFSLVIAWSGQGGVSAYRLFSQARPYPLEGTVEENETCDTRLLTSEGCGANSLFSTSTPFPKFYSTVTFTKADPVTSLPVTSTITQSSIINEQDSYRKAEKTAQWYVLSQIGEII